MNGKFSEEAGLAVNTAFLEAAKLSQGYVGSEHLLIGLAQSHGAVGELMRSLGMSASAMRRRLKEQIGLGSIDTDSRDMTPKLKKLLLKAANSIPKGISVGCGRLLWTVLSEESAGKRLAESFCGVSRLYGELENLMAEEEGMEKISKTTRKPTPLLDKNGRDLTEKALKGQLDPVIGREREEERALQILLRRTKNNPCLIGEPGVGKTAVAESIALRIAEGRVPEGLKDKRLVVLDVPSLVAGTKYRGEFEDKLRGIIEETIAAGNVILFADEIHTVVGAGAAEGAIDASNILKPYLARGELQLMGATTLKEYKKYIEKDGALERRFQTVLLEEPDEKACLAVLKGLRRRYESFHGVIIEDDALAAAVELSVRYIGERCLPDKAIDLMDEAAARRRMLTTDKRGFPTVGREDVEAVLETGLGVSLKNHRLGLECAEELKGRVFGQDGAVEKTVAALRRFCRGFPREGRPFGSMLFAGGRGVGKASLAKAAAVLAFGDEKCFFHVDMAEFGDRYGISRLLGNGDEGGVLTERVRRRPRCLVFFDNMQMAEPEALGMVRKILDEGALADGSGLTVSFKGCIVVIAFATEKGGRAGFTVVGREEEAIGGELWEKVDETVVFAACREKELTAVAEGCLEELKSGLASMGVRLEQAEDFAAAFASHCSGKGLSAGRLKRRLARRVEQLVDRELSAEKELSALLVWENGEEKLKISAKNC